MTRNAMNMTLEEHQAARAATVRAAGEAQYSSHADRQNARRLGQLRAKHPDLAAAADDLACRAHRVALRAVIGAHEELQAAAANGRQAAQAKHDAALAEAERTHAALAPAQVA